MRRANSRGIFLPLSFSLALALALAFALASRSQAHAADSALGVRVAPTPASEPLPPDADSASAPTPAVYGLFPLWEQTGAVEESGAARIGMRHAQVGIGRLTLGTDPYLDLYRTMNATAKLGIIRHGPLRLALQAAWYRVPTEAESRGIGNLHASTFSNPYAPVTLLPVALAASVLVHPRVHIHASVTALQTVSEEQVWQGTSGGVSTWVEWWASSQRSVRLHAGAEGFPAGTQEHVGLSLAWRSRYAALQGGYARRFGPEGTGGNTIMFDGAVLFP